MNVVIIGSGTSAIIAAKTFLENNHKVYLIDSENFKDNLEFKNKLNILPNLKNSPKFQNKPLINSINKFKKKYKIKTKNFFLVSGLLSGGLSNYWGAGLEIPNNKYLTKYSFGKAILKEYKYINKEIGINKRNFKFYDFFFKQKIIKDLLKKRYKSIFFSKLLLAVKHFETKKLFIRNYNNLDLLSGYNKKVYNTKFEIKKLISNKNFSYISNTFVENIKKNKNKYIIISNNKKCKKIKFNKIIISAGTVGSTILVDRILDLSEKYQMFHTPIIKIMFYSLSLPFKIRNKIKFGLALLKLNIYIENEKFCGSFMQLSNITNRFLGISKLNIFFSFIKKFFFVGNIFFPSEYSKTFIDINKSKTFIYSLKNKKNNTTLLQIRKKLNFFLKKNGLHEFPSQSYKFLQNGSDAHYTSTLRNKSINGRGILKENCELIRFKNIYILDGSSIKEGLHYPNYFLMMFVRYMAKKIIMYDKKNKN